MNRHGDFVQLPDASLLFHGKSHTRHERSPLRLAVLVDQKRYLDVVLIALEGIVFYRDLDFLVSTGIFGRDQYRSGLKGLEVLVLCLKLAGQQGILLHGRQRTGLLQCRTRGQGQVLGEGSGSAPLVGGRPRAPV